MNAYLFQLPEISSNFLMFTPTQPASATIEEAQRAERTIFTWLGVKHYKSYLKFLSQRPWLYQHSFRIQGANNLVNAAVKLFLCILVEDHCFCPHVQELSNLHLFAPCWCTAVGSAKHSILLRHEQYRNQYLESNQSEQTWIMSHLWYIQPTILSLLVANRENHHKT